LVFDLRCTGEGEKRYVVNIENGTLTYSDEIAHETKDIFPYKTPDCTVFARERVIREMIQGKFSVEDLPAMTAKGDVKIEGNPAKLAEFRSYMVTFQLLFPIVEP
jgi:alkyl sulfatase BDS1-like metallo-beta-lactamase superfamily hydrolase